MVLGAGNISSAHPDDRRQARRHRKILDHLNTLGYGAEINDDLDGIIDALGLHDTGPIIDLPTLQLSA
jgi:hypothetical protein